MAEIRFEWDAAKARANLRKHGVSFEEGESVFYDEHALLLDDPDHSEGEDRFVLLGLSDRVIRLISARKATRPEQTRYDARWKP